MSKQIVSGVELHSPKNISKIRTVGVDFVVTHTIERFYRKEGEAELGGEVIAFVLDDGEIFSADKVEEVLWIDTDGEQHWIDINQYEGFYDLPEDYLEWELNPSKVVSLKSLRFNPNTKE